MKNSNPAKTPKLNGENTDDWHTVKVTPEQFREMVARAWANTRAHQAAERERKEKARDAGS